MKKLLVLIAIMSVGTANASVRGIPVQRMQPMHQYNAYNAYQKGFRDGKAERSEQIAKVAVGVVLIATSAIIIYQLAKPSQNIPSHVQLAQF